MPDNFSLKYFLTYLILIHCVFQAFRSNKNTEWIVKSYLDPLGTSINDVQIFGVHFNPLPPPCLKFVWYPLFLNSKFHGSLNSDIIKIIECSLVSKLHTRRFFWNTVRVSCRAFIPRWYTKFNILWRSLESYNIFFITNSENIRDPIKRF